MTCIFWVWGPQWIFFFLPSLGFLECVFWQRAALPGIWKHWTIHSLTNFVVSAVGCSDLHLFAVGEVNVWVGGWQKLVFSCQQRRAEGAAGSLGGASMDWEAGAAGWPWGSSEAAGREASEKEFFQFLCKQMIYLHESFLVWVQKSFSGRLRQLWGFFQVFFE